MSTRFTLIRHGETDWNASGRWQGHAPVPLNDTGRQQARSLAAHLTPLAEDITAIYSSDSSRAAETASIIVARLKLPLQVQHDQRLREINLGEWQGLTGEEIRAWDGERWRAAMGNAAVQRPGGESPLQVAERATAALTSYAERHRNGHILVVSHGGTIRNILHGLKLITLDVERISNTSVTVIIHDDSSGDALWKLHTLNELVHLEAKYAAKDSHEG